MENEKDLNLPAAAASPQPCEKHGFPNLARARNPAQEVIDEVTAVCVAELKSAGIPSIVMQFLARDREVPSAAVGELSMWSFRRAWYYWVAEGPGIPPDIAERLHAAYGREVRVEGHCGCPSPIEWRNGFAIGSYHVDSPDGLKALADTLRSIYDADAASSQGATAVATPQAEKETL